MTNFILRMILFSDSGPIYRCAVNPIVDPLDSLGGPKRVDSRVKEIILYSIDNLSSEGSRQFHDKKQTSATLCKYIRRCHHPGKVVLYRKGRDKKKHVNPEDVKSFKDAQR